MQRVSQNSCLQMTELSTFYWSHQQETCKSPTDSIRITKSGSRRPKNLSEKGRNATTSLIPNLSHAHHRKNHHRHHADSSRDHRGAPLLRKSRSPGAHSSAWIPRRVQNHRVLHPRTWTITVLRLLELWPTDELYVIVLSYRRRTSVVRQRYPQGRRMSPQLPTWDTATYLHAWRRDMPWPRGIDKRKTARYLEWYRRGVTCKHLARTTPRSEVQGLENNI